MKKALLFCFASLGLLKLQYAQTPTWSDDIAPILYANCTACHHEGGLAPFSLMTYANAEAQKFSILNDVSLGIMPPWPPDVNYRHFKDERNLSSNEITKISAWVSGGAPQGNVANAPTPPVYTNGSELGTFDKSLQIPTYTVPTINYDMYRCFTVPTGLTQDEFITAIEVIPGNPAIVHHVLIYEDTTGASVTLDNNDAGPGYTNFGGPGFNNAALVGGWVPGTVPNVYPAGMGVKLHKNSRLVLQIHYPAGSSGQVDSTHINLRLSNGNLRQIMIQPPLNHAGTMVNGPLTIPAETVKTFEEEYTLPTNIPYAGISVLNVAPHAHLICTKWVVFATTPTGDTIPFIKINDWDFHWQGFYTLQNLVKLVPGTKLHGFATYDNTSNNPHNPNQPSQAVHVGEATTDEMMLVYFSYLIYQPGDENIVIDSSTLETPTAINEVDPASTIVTTPQLYDASPNPAANQTNISYFLPAASNATLKVYDLNGRLIDERKVDGNYGFNSLQYSTANLTAGTYLYSLVTGGFVKTKQLIVK